MVPVNWFTGWVQLWFSIAITKTVLTCCALAFKLLNATNSATAPRMRKHLTCDIDTSLDMRLAEVWNPLKVVLGDPDGHSARFPEIAAQSYSTVTGLLLLGDRYSDVCSLCDTLLAFRNCGNSRHMKRGHTIWLSRWR